MDREQRHIYFDPFSAPELLGDHAEKIVEKVMFLIKSKLDREPVFTDVPIPSICLDGHIYRGVRNLEYRDDVRNTELPCNLEICRDFSPIMETILLGEYKKENHTIVLYYNAIQEYSYGNSIDFEEKMESTLACYMFEAMLYIVAKANRIESPWSNRDGANGTKEEKEIVRVALPEFYEYSYCVESGFIRIADDLLKKWRRYFCSNWPNAQALYFLITRHPVRMLTWIEARDKHWEVWTWAISHYDVKETLRLMREEKIGLLNVDRLIKSVGMQTFVKYYAFFERGDIARCKSELSIEYKNLGSVNAKISAGIKIFELRKEKEVLQKIICSSRVNPEIWDEANRLLASIL